MHSSVHINQTRPGWETGQPRGRISPLSSKPSPAAQPKGKADKSCFRGPRVLCEFRSRTSGNKSQNLNIKVFRSVTPTFTPMTDTGYRKLTWKCSSRRVPLSEVDRDDRLNLLCISYRGRHRSNGCYSKLVLQLLVWVIGH